tara:strand:+ start:321 stop:842 length:522 start_codon:yes stop_codon:yes gene_type:complete
MLKEILEWSKAIIIALIVGLVLTVIVRPILVKGHSMEPTLGDNNYLLIEQVSYQMGHPNSGDIIVFKSDLFSNDGSQRDLIKRVIGRSGDHVEIHDGQVFLNEKRLDEKYLKERWTGGTIDLFVPPDCVFVMGDNRNNSMDSRSTEVGLVHEKQIRGRVLIRLFPVSRFGAID